MTQSAPSPLVNSRAKDFFTDRDEPGHKSRSLTFDEVTMINAGIEVLSQRQPKGGGDAFDVGAVLNILESWHKISEPDRYINGVVEYLQRLVSIGVLVEDTRGPVTRYPGIRGRNYRAPAFQDLARALHGSPGRALGLPYVAHVFGDIVVRVHRGEGDDEQIGSGVVIGNDLVVTNRHVAEGGGRIFVSWGGSDLVPATDARAPRDAKLDIATVEAPGLSPTPHPWMRAPEAAEEIVALGYPCVPQVASRPLLRFPGWVSSDGVVPTYFGHEVAVVSSVFTPGASGGGVFARDGSLVGLVMQSLESHGLKDDGTPRFSIFHAMIPADRLLSALKWMHKKCWFLNESANDEDVKRRAAEGWVEDYVKIPIT